MTELLTAAQMRAIEQAAIASGEVTGLELMERAGRGVVEAMLEWRPELAKAPHKAVVFCGPGNNGGDGFVVARLLRQRGWEVEVFLYGDEAKLPPDAAENCRRWREIEEVRPSGKFGYQMPQDADLIVDAVFGAGLTRPLIGEAGEFVDTIAGWSYQHLAEKIAIDAPSGLCLDSGRRLCEPGKRIPLADLTITFHVARRGHHLADGPACCGDLKIADIGLDRLEGRRFLLGLISRYR